MPNTYKIRGMHCASCAAIIEKTLSKVEGVEKVQANYGTESLKIEFDSKKTSPEALSNKIKPLGYTLKIEDPKNSHAHHEKETETQELLALRTKVWIVMPLVIFSIAMMIWESADLILEKIFPLLATYVLFVIGSPYLKGVLRFLRYGKANMDTLVGLGTLTAYLYSLSISLFEWNQGTYYDITIVVIGLITLGKYLEMRAKLKTGDAIQKLLALQAKTALILQNGKEIEVPIENVKYGDILVIKPGAKIPVDGEILEGKSSIDESMMSGEPLPVQKIIGDKVLAGTLNKQGAFTFKATGVGEETLLAHIIKMVEDAQNSKAPIQKLADQISAVFVPIVLGIAFLTLGLWLLIGSRYMPFNEALSYGLTCFVGVLVIACPCALGLATPTAIIVGVGKGATQGILIKNASLFEKLKKVNVVVTDKTGTLTLGKPKLIDFKNFSTLPSNDIFSILKSLEKRSEHPLAFAIIEALTEKGIPYKIVENFEAIEGKGVKGTINGVEYFAGSLNFIKSFIPSFDASELGDWMEQGKTPILLASKNEVLAALSVGDPIKPEAKKAVEKLHSLGLEVIMLTGDHKLTAQAIAKELGIDQVFAEVLPQDKRDKIIELQTQGKIVAMAGDGINDAPALAQADVGIAMGTGTDVAIESADITLLHGDILKIAQALKLSKMTLRTIKENLFWAFIYNLIGIPLAAGLFYPFFGILLNPVFAGLAMGFSSVSVITNSLRLRVKSL
jgi:Cu2+-exporting ATPase/Cu+-exporting ATPase